MLRHLLVETGALLEGHFLLSSGKHTDRYIQCAQLLQYPDKAAEFIEPLAQKLKDLDFDIVVGPAMGGIVVSYELGRQLGKPAIFVERDDEGKMDLRRGFEINPGDRVIISEDVITTGTSAKEAAEVIEAHGGEVVAFASLIDRTTADIGYPLYAVDRFEIEVVDAEDCPLCKEGIPVVRPGSRKQ